MTLNNYLGLLGTDTVLLSAAVFLVITIGFVVPLTTSPRGDFAGDPPAEADCRYNETTETLTFEIQRGGVDDRAFAGVRVFVDDKRAVVGGPDGVTDSGAWVTDEGPAAADYPLERGSTVTVYGVDPESEVYAVVVRESGSADTLIGAATPARDCPTT
jgi:hypothetical protein